QATTPIIMIMVVALYAGMACIENPNGPMAVWCSMIPFTSPVVMMVRLPYDVPLWQLALSIVLLYATAAGCVWVAARIYRTGILLYGKKHSFKEILRWIKR
ncbi:MAG: ABC transporter permease, partial [Muribaculaceae bacterium]|nr:ABC transporter permease [Muribaculaceae bacterium]